MEKMDSNTFATLNLMLGTLHGIKQPGVRSSTDYIDPYPMELWHRVDIQKLK
jgi:hypothetical protein